MPVLPLLLREATFPTVQDCQTLPEAPQTVISQLRKLNWLTFPDEKSQRLLAKEKLVTTIAAVVPTPPRRFHLVLGAGGVNCLAYVGVLKVLERAGYIPASISGCSAGTLIAALRCAGLSTAQIEQSVLSLRLETPSMAWGFPKLFRWPFAIAERNPFPDLARKFIGGDPTLAELEVPFATTALDLVSRRLMVYSSISNPGMLLSEALSIATAVPTIYPPVQIGGAVLVDAAVATKTPIWLSAANHGSDKRPILAVSAGRVRGFEEPGSVARFVQELISASAESRDDYLTPLIPRLQSVEIRTAYAAEDYDISVQDRALLIAEGEREGEALLRTGGLRLERAVSARGPDLKVSFFAKEFANLEGENG